MIYEIINPSDMSTIESDDLLVAGIACWLLSSGYGLKDESGETVFPIAFLLDTDEFLKSKGIDDTQKYINENALKIADVLETVIYASIENRKEIIEATKLMSEEDAKKYIERINEKRRTSLNNICKSGFEIARKLREMSKV